MVEETMSVPRTARVSWLSVAVYYVLACGVSWPFFWWRDFHHAAWAAWGAPTFVKGLLPACGPALAAIVSLVLFRRTHHRTVTLLGTNRWRSVLFLGVPVVVLGALGVGDDDPHLTGLWWGVVYGAYGIGEEMGWRGFLQDAVRPLAPLRRYLLIGLLWGGWHFSTFLGGTPSQAAIRMAEMIVLWVVGSWGIGNAADLSGSVLVAAALHLGFNFMTALPPQKAIPLLAVSGVAWVLLLRTWRPSGGGSAAAGARENPEAASGP